MEPWFAALARPTAAVPSAAVHNNALAWRTSLAGAVANEQVPPAQPAAHPSSPKAPAAATIPPTTTTDHYLSDTTRSLEEGLGVKADGCLRKGQSDEAILGRFGALVMGASEAQRPKTEGTDAIRERPSPSRYTPGGRRLLTRTVARAELRGRQDLPTRGSTTLTSPATSKVSV
jgi:hypothetical protein